MEAFNLGVAAALWFMSVGYLVFNIRYAYATRGDDNATEATRRYKWTILFGAMGISVLITLIFLNDWGLIDKDTQKDFGIIWRVLFGLKILSAFRAIKADGGFKIVSFSLLFGLIVWVLENSSNGQ